MKMIKNLLACAVMFTAFTSCRHEELKEINADYSVQEMSIGRKLGNPYSVKNMAKAYSDIMNDSKISKSNAMGKESNHFDVKTTHLYVMYKFQNEEEYANFKADSTIISFDYPLDYEFTDEELEARPALPEGELPTLYATIKADSDVKDKYPYKLLEELYIPEEDEFFEETDDNAEKSVNPNSISSRSDLLTHLLVRAYENTGNVYEVTTNHENRWIFGRKWYPSGRILVHDDVIGRDVPVVGAQVLIRQWFTVRQAITDGNGSFTAGSVRGRAKYVLQWERYHYSIRNGSFFQAETKSSTKNREAWYPTLNNDRDKYFAIIHQAAHDYYYGHRLGLQSPPMNNHFYPFIGRLGQIKIAARLTTNHSVPSSFSHIRNELTFGLLAQVHVKKYKKPADEIYGTTIHELAHAAHSIVDRASYDNLVRDSFLSFSSQTRNRNRRLLETWAATVETLLTLDRYKNKYNLSRYSVYQKDRINNFQNVSINESNHYTSGGYDMIDDYNQRAHHGESYPMDRVKNYTPRQLEDALVGARHWYQWRDNVKRRYHNPTSVHLDELFSNWKD